MNGYGEGFTKKEVQSLVKQCENRQNDAKYVHIYKLNKSSKNFLSNNHID